MKIPINYLPKNSSKKDKNSNQLKAIVLQIKKNF